MESKPGFNIHQVIVASGINIPGFVASQIYQLNIPQASFPVVVNQVLVAEKYDRFYADCFNCQMTISIRLQLPVENTRF